MKQKVLYGVACMLLALCAACSGGGGRQGYAEQVRTDYINSCTAGGSDQEYCRCTLEAFETRYTYDELSELLDAVDRGDRLGEFLSIIAECS